MLWRLGVDSKQDKGPTPNADIAIAKRTLREFYQQPQYRDAKGPLEAWHAEALKAGWQTPHEIKAQIRSASIITHSLVVFTIAGNKYRLVVDVDYSRGAMFVKFVGNHAQYDKLDLRGKGQSYGY